MKKNKKIIQKKMDNKYNNNINIIVSKKYKNNINIIVGKK